MKRDSLLLVSNQLIIDLLKIESIYGLRLPAPVKNLADKRWSGYRVVSRIPSIISLTA